MFDLWAREWGVLAGATEGLPSFPSEDGVVSERWIGVGEEEQLLGQSPLMEGPGRPCLVSERPRAGLRENLLDGCIFTRSQWRSGLWFDANEEPRLYKGPTGFLLFPLL